LPIIVRLWSSSSFDNSNAYYIGWNHNETKVNSSSHNIKSGGFSVRCVRDVTGLNVPTVSLLSIDSITQETAKVTSEVTDMGKANEIYERANFWLMGPKDTMVKSKKPVIAVGATRTGCGKSQTSRKIIEYLVGMGFRVVAVRHPMPYDPDLNKQIVQRFACVDDLKYQNCTIEEMEEYEPHVVTKRNVIYAGVDYEAILKGGKTKDPQTGKWIEMAGAENDPDGCDIVLWDGGNNDFPFYVPDLTIGVADPLRPGAEVSYYPGEVVARMADVIVINKIDSASLENINTVRANLRKINPTAKQIDAASVLTVDKPELLKGKKVLVVEDGPTLTHGEMKIGAGTVAALKHGAELVDPRPYVVGKLAETFQIYPNIGTLLPAMGYGEQQMKDLEKTIANTPCDAVVIGPPIDLPRFIKIKQPVVKVGYELQEIGTPTLKEVLDEFVAKHNLKPKRRKK